jgi:hypothetical protein
MCFGFVEPGALFRRISKSVWRKPLTNAASGIRDQDFFSDPRGYRHSAELRRRLDFGRHLKQAGHTVHRARSINARLSAPPGLTGFLPNQSLTAMIQRSTSLAFAF